MYTNEQLNAARTAEVYDFLLSRHGSQVKKEGAYLRVPGNGGLLVHRGYYGYYDSTHDKHGNSVDLLVEYFGYDLKGAVEALIGEAPAAPKPQEKREDITLSYAEMPTPTKEKYSRVWAYLHRTRGLSSEVINKLMKEHLLYQDERGNAVFIDKDQTIAEIRGTSTYKSFRGTRRAKKPNGFWWFQPNGRSERVYVCESAIDAVSLYLLLKDENATYVSMAGVGNRSVIERIARTKQVIVCTDNDAAGQAVRNDFPNLPALIPHNKDWNEDLKGEMNNDDNAGEKTA